MGVMNDLLQPSGDAPVHHHGRHRAGHDPRRDDGPRRRASSASHDEPLVPVEGLVPQAAPARPLPPPGATPDLFGQAGGAGDAPRLAITLDGPTDLDGFRRACRGLLASQVQPSQVSWHTSDDAVGDLFQAINEVQASDPSLAQAPTVGVPPDFLKLCQEVILHSDPQRFGLLYRLLWRLVHEPGLRHDPLDADRVQAGHMAQAVRRDMHKMKAFVRFRSVQDDSFRSDPEGGPLHVAWFEPEHHIVEAVTPFFERRFTQMRWAILTPERSAEWDGGQLRFGPGARKEDAPPPDAGEQLWLTYYRHIFNPARLKLRMMHKEMPRKYWRNLPEAELISPLAASAHERSGRMVESPGTVPARRIPRVIPIVPARTARVENTSEDSKRSDAVDARDPGVLDGELLPPTPHRSLQAIREATNRCRECPIGEHATQSVCGEGPRQAALMFVGEQPGDQEDLQGRPFVGPAGQLFDQALAQLGIARDAVFVANAVKHFKYELRGQRRIHKTPSQREAAACAHWLEDEIGIVQPQLLVALGATAARTLLGRAVPVMASRGQVFQREDGREVLVTLHPSALLRMPPGERDAAFADWLADMASLQAVAHPG